MHRRDRCHADRAFNRRLARRAAAPLLLIYSMAIPADSGALTSGMTLSAQPDYRGATMALHSTVGFGLSAAGGWAIGVALDAGGGMEPPSGGSSPFW